MMKMSENDLELERLKQRKKKINKEIQKIRRILQMLKEYKKRNAL